MPRRGPLIGRDVEQAELGGILAEAAGGRGGVALVAGEAGVGKTRLVEATIRAARLRVLRGQAVEAATPPFGPLAAALRSHLRDEPAGLPDCGPLTPYLAVLLPELGAAPPGADPGTLLEALRRLLEELAPVVVFLDDLQWADQATLDLLPPLAASAESRGVLLVGAYRSDEIPRGHGVRRLRRDLRRTGRLRELALEPLDASATGALVERTLGAPAGPELALLVHDRTQGVPFFVEELAVALAATNRLFEGSDGLGLAGDDVPIPETVRDAVLLRVQGLDPAARAALEGVAVAGMQVDFDLLAGLGAAEGLEDALELGLLVEPEPGLVGFRHALSREAVYAGISWTRRRRLHGAVATALQARAGSARLVGEHWLAAREPERARVALLAAVDDALAVHAYRDALTAARQALSLWPDDEAIARFAVLERLASCAELCGELGEAVAAWEEVAVALNGEARAEILRRLASALDLQGAWERASGARREAASEFAAAGRPADAAQDRLAVAAHLDSAGAVEAAQALAETAERDALAAGRSDLVARALGIQATSRAKAGDAGEAVALGRRGLELALASNDVGAASELYQRLANVLENAADYRAAGGIYEEAHAYCADRGAGDAAAVCLICLGFINFQLGDWDRTVALDRQLIEDPATPAAVRINARGQWGVLLAARGQVAKARPLLAEMQVYGEHHERQRVEIWADLALAWVAEQTGAPDVAGDWCRLILDRFGEAESRHYPVPALRWAATFFARRGLGAEARACAQALAGTAAASPTDEALAALAHALGETALLEGEPEAAALHFARALELLRRPELPFETAQTQVRAAAALALAGDREAAVERLTSAYRIARKLRARPLAEEAAADLGALGEQADRRLARGAAEQGEHGGLTRRELEVMRLVAVGRTNREIARELFLSHRTVEMHVRNILAKLDCRSRGEASHRAGELGLVG